MDFTNFISNIDLLVNSTLKGRESHLKLAPKIRMKYSDEVLQNKQPKKAAVLALFYPNENNETMFLLTERASYKGIHSAQISFPGGKNTPEDKTPWHTAIRETFEEVGVSQMTIHHIKELSKTYIPPSNFMVTPFLGYISKKPTLITNHEVSKTIEVKLVDLMDSKNLIIKNMSTSYMKNIDVPCFKLNGYTVWGATAMILSEIKDILKEL